MDLRRQMGLAGHCLLAWPDPEEQFLPIGGYEVAHDVGRWWDAVLRLENSIAFNIPAKLEAAMLKHLQRLTDNPDGLLMNCPDTPGIGGKVRINPHNLREGLLAFNALVRFRQSLWAKDAGHRLVETMARCIGENGHFDFTRLHCWNRIPLTDDPSHTESERNGWFDATGTTGRSLEALVWYFEATGDPLAFEVAQRIATHHLKHSTNEDGSIREEIIHPQNVGHSHSFQGTLRGLLLFGLHSAQQEYVDVVAATYYGGLQQYVVRESGWVPHDLGKTRFPNNHGDPTAETASTGDSAQLALWLALRAGHLNLLDDVERLTRARILPAQITKSDKNGSLDPRIAAKQLGGWGSHGPPHSGTRCILDILAAVTHSLCDIYNNITTNSPMAVAVNLHLDYENLRVKVLASRNSIGRVAVRVKQSDNVTIRVPEWTPRESVHITVNKVPRKAIFVESSVWIPKQALRENSEIVMTYELPERFTKEEMPSSGQQFRFKWRGDQIVGIEPQEKPSPFYAVLSD